MKMLPGIGKMAGKLEAAGVDDSIITRQESIIFSMTKKERANPDLLNASRKKRIAAGSGTSVQDVNKLYKQLQQMQTVMKQIRKMGMGGMMKQMKGLMGGSDMAEFEALAAQSMDADALAGDMAALEGNDNPLGPNPFAGGTMPNFGTQFPGLENLLKGKK
jgi:signal recognition particle subunit SRP54